eukprot:8323429-Pyramimonas_sp.AAC.1
MLAWREVAHAKRRIRTDQLRQRHHDGDQEAAVGRWVESISNGRAAYARDAGGCQTSSAPASRSTRPTSQAWFEAFDGPQGAGTTTWTKRTRGRRLRSRSQ